MRLRRRGRKRKEAARHPGGKIRQKSTASRAEETIATALEARRRVFGLSAAEARRPEAVDMLGRLALTGEISEAQLSAGRAYARLRRNYDRALLARRLASAADYDGPGGPDGRDGNEPGYRAWARRMVAAYDAVRRALLECSDPLATTVLDGIVLEERAMWRHVGTLRIALNAVGRVTGTSEVAGTDDRRALAQRGPPS